MSQSIIDQIDELIENEEHDKLFELFDNAQGEDRWTVLEAALEEELTEDVLERLAPLTQDPESPGKEAEPWSLKGLAHYYDDEIDDALEAFSAALQINPRHIPALMGRSLVMRELEYDSAAKLDIGKAQWLLEDVTAETEDEDKRQTKAEVHRVLANMALEDEDIDAARAAFEVATEVGYEDASYPLELARLLSLEGELIEAIEAVNKSVERDDVGLEALLLKSHLLGMAGKNQEAIEVARSAVAIDPEEPYSQAQLASVLLLAGRTQEVLEACDKAIELEPEMPDSYSLKAAALQALGRAEEIDAQWEHFLQEPPDLPGFMYGDNFDPYEEAADTLAELGNMDPNDLMAMANQLFQSGQIPEALRPLMEQAMRDLPAMLQQMPDLMKAMPPGMADQLGALNHGSSIADDD